MKILFKLSLFFFLFTNVSNADLVKPNSTLKPFDVLMIQLNSLKNNNTPYEDAGIEQTWEFAHPINKASTGPLERFKQMIYGESYKILISHENNKIIILKESAKKFVYKVYVLSKDKKRYYYIWQIEKVEREGNLKDAFMMLPFKEPSQTLLQLMGVVVSAGQRFASIADLQVGDGNQQAAVGTTVAMLERGSRVMSAIHKRLYAAMKKEFGLLARIFKLYLPPIYPYDVVGGQRQIKQLDFDDRVDILPVADPNIFSQTQRISLAQTELQLAASNPQIHNQYEIYRNMYEALGVKDIDLILKKPPQPMPKDPALEHIDALAGLPFQAFPGQDHRAHITAHLNFLATNMVRTAPMVTAAVEKNCLEHISLMAQEQIELEFKDELQQLAQMQQMMQQNPQIQQQMVPLQQKIEARK